MSRLPDIGADTVNNLPICEIAAGSIWNRIGSVDHKSPIFWSSDPGGRFNPRSTTFGVSYLSDGVTGAIAESICRNAAALKPSQKFTTESVLRKLGCHEITISKPLKLLDFTIANWAKYRLDVTVMTEYAINLTHGPPNTMYRWGPAWSDHAHKMELDGILYHSRHHTDCRCLALFECSAMNLQATLLDTCEAAPVLAILEHTFDWAILDG